ncbi:N-acetylglucosamine-1-phosphodiester alpha-N-acetylglucosaminidase-like, partial [Uloborus diversus]|uniref:N-acetylglucosamine-1-phosphodiester alpha-N-acetylglucosaminidase-like n=1 Tax=Uloborus diversus TaxID=327109 RepID=UPI00240A4A50
LSSPFLNRIVRGHLITVSNALDTLSVLEPDQTGGCNLNVRQTVAKTAEKAGCTVAINAGYFDTKKGSCLGNIVSDGRPVHDSNGVQNVHFGLTKDGQIFTGYLSKEMYLSGNFLQLVGGVVWVIRNGTGFVNSSKMLECEDTEETGPMDRFVNVRSARSVVGHDSEGNVVFVQVDGKTDIDGINLFEMEALLKEFGVINGINLDGGGSSTLVINGTTSNYPYDSCPSNAFSCDREVSTVLCVHSPYCDPKDCSNHGKCLNGQCLCENNWLAPKCDRLFCGKHNCSNNGLCLPSGCICRPGYFGENCESVCPEGKYGSQCAQQCECMNARGCDFISGSCHCKPGFMGKSCEHPCPEGFFGENCHFKCQCDNSCFCDPLSGSCALSKNSTLYHTAECFAENIIKEQKLVKDNPEERRKWYTTLLILGVITTVCITSFLVIIFCSCSCYCRNEQLLCSRRSRRSLRRYPLEVPSGELSDSFSDSEYQPMKSFNNK